MSVAGILSSSLFNYSSESVQNKKLEFQKELQQLGQDLQSGSLSAAQTDVTSLQQSRPQVNSSLPAVSNNPIAQDFKQLSQDLQSGNVSAAQQDYTKIQQDFQSQAAGKHAHRHHRGGGNEVSQLLEQLGQDLQTGSLSAAQQAYNALQQDFQQFGQTSDLVQPSTSSSVSVSA